MERQGSESKVGRAELTPGKIQYLVRLLARQSKGGQGARPAEYMCNMLYGVVEWIRQGEPIPETAAIPKRFWKVRLKQEWLSDFPPGLTPPTRGTWADVQ